MLGTSVPISAALGVSFGFHLSHMEDRRIVSTRRHCGCMSDRYLNQGATAANMACTRLTDNRPLAQGGAAPSRPPHSIPTSIRDAALSSACTVYGCYVGTYTYVHTEYYRHALVMQGRDVDHVAHTARPCFGFSAVGLACRDSKANPRRRICGKPRVRNATPYQLGLENACQRPK